MTTNPVKLARYAASIDNLVDSEFVVPIAMKVLYEFFGFCVNTPDSLYDPIGIEATTFPSDFLSGTVVTASVDGSTYSAGPGRFSSTTVDFVSLHATSSLIDSFITMWKPDSTSPDDSIYRIIGVDADTSELILDPYSGGGTVQYGNKPTFENRSGIYFRIVDLSALEDIAGWADGQYMIVTLSGSMINSNQSNSQVQMFLRGTQGNLGVVVSPSGSWDGATFSDGSTEYVQSPVFYNPAAAGPGSPYYYIAADKAGFVIMMDGIVDVADFSGYPYLDPCVLHVEVPKRLYPEENDPNPVAFFMSSRVQASFNSSVASYYDEFRMVDHDGIVRQWTATMRSPWGDSPIDSIFTFGPTGYEPWYVTTAHHYAQYDLDEIAKSIISSDVVLMNLTTDHFSFGRARLRLLRAGNVIRSRGARYGRTFVSNLNGVLWPWDNSVIPGGPFWNT